MCIRDRANRIINKKKNVGNVGRRKGATVRDVDTWRWVKTMAKHFKDEGKLFVPSCTEIVKTSHGRERAPQNNDWYYIRCAAVLRAIYLRPGTGYGGLAKRFSNKKNRGSRPEIYCKAATGLLHWCCRSLEGLKLLAKGKEQGRVITKAGRKRADTIAFNTLIRRGGKKVAKK
eukprot:TRINITY_DN1849_c0_g1_i2.p2 TRINITY_DN1849_c0_g1~~TRINITY_DN1849_c0_g1_i2.p2  ORF type:complete len:173 (+),score=86.80 TRINITY_DN1849_c0_g1_i2:169-687(+)